MSSYSETLINSHTSSDKLSSLKRRKGGGGGRGKGGGSSGKGSGKGGGGGSSPAKGSGASSSFYNSPFARPFAVSSGTSAVAYSSGGGKRFTLGNNSPFPGRQAGGADRSTVFGTSRYGSGYPYGASGSYVSGRPFPYGFYPVSITNYNYYGSIEYNDVNATQRPGGPLMYAVVQPPSNTPTITFRIVGDNSSVTAVYTALITNCTIANTSSITPYTPSPSTYPLPEQVLQWYRASTFALSLDQYNNTAALLGSMPTDPSQPAPALSMDSPLPSTLNTTFLACLNATIGASVPLLYTLPPQRLPLIQIAGIVIGGLSALCSIVYLSILVWGSCIDRRKAPARQKSLLEGHTGYEKCESRAPLDESKPPVVKNLLEPSDMLEPHRNVLGEPSTSISSLRPQTRNRP